MIEEMTPYIFTCDVCTLTNHTITDKTMALAVERMRNIGWRVEEHQQEYKRGPTNDEIANKGYPGAYHGDVNDHYTVYDRVVCLHCCEKEARNGL